LSLNNNDNDIDNDNDNDKILLVTRVLIRYTSIFHKALNTTEFNNNNNMI